MGNFKPFYGNKTSKFYEKEKAKAEKIIAKQKLIIAECDRNLAKNATSNDSTKA